jgi:hypothetical protein
MISFRSTTLEQSGTAPPIHKLQRDGGGKVLNR